MSMGARHSIVIPAQVKWVNKKYRVTPFFRIFQARQAARSGFRLELADNQAGRVTFRLQATDSSPDP